MQEKRFQNRITLFTFALTILVIWVHSVNLEPDMLNSAGLSALERQNFYPAALFLERFLTELIGQMAVPGFFIVSAYLFFRNAPAQLSARWIAGKWKRRLFSVLLPYLIWNGLFYLGRIAAFAVSGSRLLPAAFEEATAVPVDAASVFSAVFLYAYNPVFWYLKQLIILIALSPVIWFLLKKCRQGTTILILSLLAAGFWEWIPVHVVNEDALFYFMLGSYGALHGRDFLELWEEKRSGRIFYFTVFVLLCSMGERVICSVFPQLIPEILRGTAAAALFTVLMRASFSVFFLLLILRCSERKKEAQKNRNSLRSFLERDRLPAFMQINFFIYATHYIPVRAINRGALSLLGTALSGGGGSVQAVSALCLLLLIYLLLPVICTLLAWLFSMILKSNFPAVWRALSGGR